MKPIKGSFNNILAAIGAGTGKGKRAAEKAARRQFGHPIKASEPKPDKKP
jgi:hypothetical protein